MSADNGIYVIKIADKDYRVCYAMGFDNHDYWISAGYPTKAFDDYWKEAPSFECQEMAIMFADEKSLHYSMLEYGVVYVGDYSHIFSGIANNPQ